MSERRAARPLLTLCVPSRAEFLALLREVTRRVAEIAGFDHVQAERLALAVDEASANVIHYAYRGAGDRLVALRYRDEPGALRIEIVDDGARVDPRRVPPADVERRSSERRSDAPGSDPAERVMDSISVRHSARRNVCCMVKRKPPDSAPS